MKKENFVSLLLGVTGTLIFGIGMCMALITEWNMFKAGVVVTAVGALVLLGLAIMRWNMAGRPTAKVNVQKAGKVAYCVISALVLGLGMCMIMVWNMIIPGILVGVAGIVMLLCIIPLVKGLH